MIIWTLRRLIADLLAQRRKNNASSLVAFLLRGVRVFAYLRENKTLLDLDVYKNYVARSSDNLFHYLSQRNYLIEGLPVRQRIECALAHYQFEDATFNSAYKRKVYLEGGVCLWRYRSTIGTQYVITLAMSPRWAPEGELSICLFENEITLHSLSFNWIKGSLAELPDAFIPFLGRNQGRKRGPGSALMGFEKEFPNNSPSFFCFAAMQGIARALAVKKVIGARAKANICSDVTLGENFVNAYDGFWKKLGGVELHGFDGYLISLPFYEKPLSEIPSKHRKRAAQRREFWKSISNSSSNTIQRYLNFLNVYEEDEKILKSA